MVNSVNAARQDDYYHRELAHTGRPGFLGVTVQSYNAQGQPVGSAETGEVYGPRGSETLTYDADGNLLGDGRWVYGWKREDRLVSMETQPQAVSGIPAAESVKLLFDYDWLARRIRKRVYQPATAGTPMRTERYAWDVAVCSEAGREADRGLRRTTNRARSLYSDRTILTESVAT